MQTTAVSGEGKKKKKVTNSNISFLVYTTRSAFVQEASQMQNLTLWPSGLPRGLQHVHMCFSRLLLPLCYMGDHIFRAGAEAAVAHIARIATDACTNSSAARCGACCYVRLNYMLVILF